MYTSLSLSLTLSFFQIQNQQLPDLNSLSRSHPNPSRISDHHASPNPSSTASNLTSPQPPSPSYSATKPDGLSSLPPTNPVPLVDRLVAPATARRSAHRPLASSTTRPPPCLLLLPHASSHLHEPRHRRPPSSSTRPSPSRATPTATASAMNHSSAAQPRRPRPPSPRPPSLVRTPQPRRRPRCDSAPTARYASPFTPSTVTAQPPRQPPRAARRVPNTLRSAPSSDPELHLPITSSPCYHPRDPPETSPAEHVSDGCNSSSSLARTPRQTQPPPPSPSSACHCRPTASNSSSSSPPPSSTPPVVHKLRRPRAPTAAPVSTSIPPDLDSAPAARMSSVEPARVRLLHLLQHPHLLDESPTALF